MRLTTLTTLCAFSATTLLAQSHETSGAAALAAMATASPAASASAPTTGAMMPVDLQKYQQLIAANKGHYLVVDFWRTTCGPCREELPRLMVLADSLRAAGINFVTVSGDDSSATAEAVAYLDSLHAPAERYVIHTEDVDGFLQGINKEWMGNLPAMFVYSPSGELVHSFMSGEVENKELRDVLQPQTAETNKK